MQSMEIRPAIPDRKLLARLVLIREEARSMMGGGILDERNGRGFSTLPESEVCFALDSYLMSWLLSPQNSLYTGQIFACNWCNAWCGIRGNKYLHVIVGAIPGVESELFISLAASLGTKII